MHIEHVPAAARAGLGTSGFEEVCDESGMMVLFEKHVHLQNDGGEAAIAVIMSTHRTKRRLSLAMSKMAAPDKAIEEDDKENQ